MSEYAILSFEDVLIFWNGSYVFWVTCASLWPHEIPELSDTLLSVENLLIHYLGLHIERVEVWFTSYDVCLLGTSVHESLAVKTWDGHLGAYWSLRGWKLWSFTIRHLLTVCEDDNSSCSLSLSSIMFSLLLEFVLVVLHIIKRHPAHFGLVDRVVFWLRDLQVISSLVWLTGIWWVITDVVSLVSWILFDFDMSSVHFSILDLARLKNMGWGSSRDSVLHVWVFFLDVDYWLLISPDIDVFDGIVTNELLKRPKRVNSAMSDSCCLETFRPIKKIELDQKSKMEKRATYFLKAGFISLLCFPLETKTDILIF